MTTFDDRADCAAVRRFRSSLTSGSSGASNPCVARFAHIDRRIETTPCCQARNPSFAGARIRVRTPAIGCHASFREYGCISGTLRRSRQRHGYLARAAIVIIRSFDGGSHSRRLSGTIDHMPHVVHRPAGVAPDTERKRAIAAQDTPSLRSWEICQINTGRCVLCCFGAVASAGGLLLRRTTTPLCLALGNIRPTARIGGSGY